MTKPKYYSFISNRWHAKNQLLPCTTHNIITFFAGPQVLWSAVRVKRTPYSTSPAANQSVDDLVKGGTFKTRAKTPWTLAATSCDIAMKQVVFRCTCGVHFIRPTIWSLYYVLYQRAVRLLDLRSSLTIARKRNYILIEVKHAALFVLQPRRNILQYFSEIYVFIKNFVRRSNPTYQSM